MAFEFATAGRVVFGAGRLSEAGDLVRTCGAHALVVTGRTPERAAPLLALLRERRVGVTLFSTPGEPEIGTVRNGTAVARAEGCDCVVGFGGGAALDAAKAIAALIPNKGDVLDYLEIIGGGEVLTTEPVPFVAIPTTAGTGSEVTANSVLSSPEHRVKVSLRSPMMLAKIAVVDPELTYDLPPAVTAATGLDTLVQVIEPFVSKRANPLCDGLCREGMVRVARVAGRLRGRMQHESARGYGGCEPVWGYGLGERRLGGSTRSGRSTGRDDPRAHGALCAVLAPPVVEMNLQALRVRGSNSDALTRYAEVAYLLTGDPQAQPEDAVEWLKKLVADLGMPRLSSYGFAEADIPELVEKAGRAGSMKPNPVELTSEELATIVRAAL